MYYVRDVEFGFSWAELATREEAKIMKNELEVEYPEVEFEITEEEG